MFSSDYESVCLFGVNFSGVTKSSSILVCCCLLYRENRLVFSSGKKLISHCLCVAVQLVEISIVWCLVLPLNRFVCLFGVDFSRFYFCVCVCVL